MESERNQYGKPAASLIPPLPRDHRGSLEVFNPTSFSTSRPGNPTFRTSHPTWQGWSGGAEPDPESKPNVTDGITSWMALKEPTPALAPAPAFRHESPPTEATATRTIAEIFTEHEVPVMSSGDAVQRAAEWGLVLKTDQKTGKLQGVKVRTSDDDQNKPTRRESGNSVRSSDEFSDEGIGMYIFSKL